MSRSLEPTYIRSRLWMGASSNGELHPLLSTYWGCIIQAELRQNLRWARLSKHPCEPSLASPLSAIITVAATLYDDEAFGASARRSYLLVCDLVAISALEDGSRIGRTRSPAEGYAIITVATGKCSTRQISGCNSCSELAASRLKLSPKLNGLWKWVLSNCMDGVSE